MGLFCYKNTTFVIILWYIYNEIYGKNEWKISYFRLFTTIMIKFADMEITIKLDERSKQGKAFYEHLKTLPFVEFIDPRYNEETETALEEVKSGKTTKISLPDLRKELY